MNITLRLSVNLNCSKLLSVAPKDALDCSRQPEGRVGKPEWSALIFSSSLVANANYDCNDDKKCDAETNPDDDGYDV
jgi:hypothetical protein